MRRGGSRPRPVRSAGEDLALPGRKQRQRLRAVNPTPPRAHVYSEEIEEWRE